MIQIAFRPDGVIQPPVGHRRTGHPGTPETRRAEEAVQGIGASPRPSPQADTAAIHPRLRLQPAHGRLLRRQIDLAEAARLLRNKDEALEAVIDEMAEMLGLGIVNLVNIFNLDRVILGGAIRPILPFMLEKTRSVVDQRALAHPRANVKIKVSGRDDDSVFGAAYLVLEAHMTDPVPLVRPETQP